METEHPHRHDARAERGGDSGSTAPGRGEKHLAVASAVVLGLCFVLMFRWEAPQQTTTGSRATGPKRKLVEVTAAAWIGKSPVRPGEVVPVWVQLRNQSGESIDGLRFVDFRIPGFTEETCWMDGAPACNEEGRLVGLPSELRAGETATVEASVRPASTGSYLLSGVYSWKTTAAGPFRATISVGPVEVVSWWRTAFRNSASRIHLLFKDLGIPIAAVWLAFFFQTLQKEAERKRKEDEDRRQREREKAAEERTRQHETLRQLLQQSIRDTQNYYLHVLRRTSSLLRTFDEAEGDGDDERDACFHSFVMLFNDSERLRRDIGGIHFQNRLGENVAGLAWLEMKRRTDARLLPREVWQAALKLVKRDEELLAFKRRLSFEPFQSLKQQFDDWLTAKEEPLATCLPLVKIVRHVFAFEINRPFETWYGRPEPFPGEELRSLRGELPADTPTELLDLLRDYIEDEEGGGPH